MATVEKAFAFAKDPATPKLGLSLGGKKVGGGQHVPKAETQDTPTITLKSPEGTYIVVGIDLDAPFATIPFLSPILHWMQPGLRASSSAVSAGETELTASDVPYVAEYHGAGPPPGAGPHRYVFLLYKQPEGFDGKRFGQPPEGQRFAITKRMRFDFPGFVKTAKLGEPVAAEWFTSN